MSIEKKQLEEKYPAYSHLSPESKEAVLEEGKKFGERFRALSSPLAAVVSQQMATQTVDLIKAGLIDVKEVPTILALVGDLVTVAFKFAEEAKAAHAAQTAIASGQAQQA